MPHIHPVNDTDTHFIIDGATRSVKNVADVKSMLVQYDHNSERFTFEVPRVVDDHDLSTCNIVRVHFINVEKSKRTENTGISDITESLAVCPEDDNFVTCSWLIPDKATQLVGSLHFVIQFACFDDDKILYSWNTARHTNVFITDGIYNGEAVVNDSHDIIEKWRTTLESNTIESLEQIQTSNENGGINVWQAVFGDGRKSELYVKNGEKGETGLIGSIETVDGKTMNFFHGNNEDYEKLSNDQRVDTFAVVIDDPNAVEVGDLSDRIQELEKLPARIQSLEPLPAKVQALESRPTTIRKYLVYANISQRNIETNKTTHNAYFSYIAIGDKPNIKTWKDLVDNMYYSLNFPLPTGYVNTHRIPACGWWKYGGYDTIMYGVGVRENCLYLYSFTNALNDMCSEISDVNGSSYSVSTNIIPLTEEDE